MPDSCATFQVVCRLFMIIHYPCRTPPCFSPPCWSVRTGFPLTHPRWWAPMPRCRVKSEKLLKVVLARCGVCFHCSALLIWSGPAFKVLTECYASPLATLACLNEGNEPARMAKCHKDVFKLIKQQRISAVVACNFKLRLYCRAKLVLAVVAGG